MDTTDDSLFSRMKTTGSIKFTAALLKSLHDSEAAPLVAIVEDMVKETPRPSWEAVLEMLCKLESQESSILFRTCVSESDFTRMKVICQARALTEQKTLTQLSSEGYALWQKIGHLQGNTLRPALSRWIDACGCGQDMDVASLASHFGTWDAFIEAVRGVKQVSEATPAPSPEAWEEVLIRMCKRAKSVQPDWYGFGTCAFCWRLCAMNRTEFYFGAETAQEMREGPSKPAVRGRLQTTASCDGQEPWW